MSDYTPSKQAYHVNYYAGHKDHILEVRKKWYDRNKEKIKEKRNVFTKCDCGMTVKLHYFNHHLTTLKHINNLNMLNKQKSIYEKVNSFLNKNI